MSWRDFVSQKFVQHSTVIGNVIKRSVFVEIAVIIQDLTVAHSFISIFLYHRVNHRMKLSQRLIFSQNEKKAISSKMSSPFVSIYQPTCSHFYSSAVLLAWNLNWTGDYIEEWGFSWPRIHSMSESFRYQIVRFNLRWYKIDNISINHGIDIWIFSYRFPWWTT